MQTRIEDLPNELFIVIFSYLAQEMVLQTFSDLNQRFQALIRQLTHHLVLSSDTNAEKYIKFIADEIESITMSIELIPRLFSGGYSYANLRLVTIYSNNDWRVELVVENHSPVLTIVSVLNVLEKCSLNSIEQPLSNLIQSERVRGMIRSSQVKSSNMPKWISNVYSLVTNQIFRNRRSSQIEIVSPCSAIQRLWIDRCSGSNLANICELAPELRYLKLGLRSSRENPVVSLIYLEELDVKVVDLQALNYARQLIYQCRDSLRRICLNFGNNLRIDGNILESLLSPLNAIETIAFISRFPMGKITMSNLLSSFQSQWWMDPQRPSVLIHQVNFDDALVVSIPSSFPRVLKGFRFSTDLRSWRVNRGTFQSLINGGIGVKNLFFATTQPISLEFLRFIGRIFHSPKQIVECRYWGLTFEQEYFQNSSPSIPNLLLPNVTQLNITYINGLTPLTLILWFHLAPNIRILRINYLTYSEIIEWITDLEDSSLLVHLQVKRMFERISRIRTTSLCYNCDERLRENLWIRFSRIFPNVLID